MIYSVYVCESLNTVATNVSTPLRENVQQKFTKASQVAEKKCIKVKQDNELSFVQT